MAIEADGPDLDPATYGAKAAGLQQLLRFGLPVPPAVVVPISSAAEIAEHPQKHTTALRAAMSSVVGGNDRLAVRAGAAYRIPGAFASMLDVLPEVVGAAITAVVESSKGLRVQTIARGLGFDLVPRTAVIIQRQVDATADARSGAGVAASRHPVTGQARATGSFVWQVKGDAVMSATTPVIALAAMTERAPEAHAQLLRDLTRLSREVGQPVEVEFTVEAGELWYLDLRTFEIDPEPAALPPGSLVIAEGQPAGRGLGRGTIHTDVDAALDAVDAGDDVVLVLEMSTPADVTAMVRSAAVLTVLGGRESHAAVITRGEGIPSVLAVQGLQIGDGYIMLGERRFDVGAELMVDGTTGRIARPPGDD